jgi:type IV pilus assembly protein PilX
MMSLYSLNIKLRDRKKQQGAALIISIIILGVLTVIGVASMQQSGLELKMIASAHDRSVAFEAAETALREIEKELSLNPPLLTTHYSNCNGATCFNSQCTNGLCFSGEYYADTERSQCYISNPDTANQRDFWTDAELDVWNQVARHKTLAINGLRSPVKYIIEFLCFTNVGTELGAGYSTQGAAADASENENFKPLYRITALAGGNASRATVILQSTYRIATES